jgi:hypothetical protein
MAATVNHPTCPADRFGVLVLVVAAVVKAKLLWSCHGDGNGDGLTALCHAVRDRPIVDARALLLAAEQCGVGCGGCRVALAPRGRKGAAGDSEPPEPDEYRLTFADDQHHPAAPGGVADEHVAMIVTAADVFAAAHRI